jgi:formylglycine-generating enzyme required for sulfatase activity
MTLRAATLVSTVLAAYLLLGAQAVPKNDSDRNFKECPECQDMVAIPAGKFLMGSPAHEPGRFDSEGPQHVVTVKAFALSKYPVTSAEFLAFLNATGYRPQPCNPLLGLGWRQLHRGLAATPTDVEPPRWPAVCLDWKDAEAFIAWINARARAAHSEIGNRNPYRLPSEAEWEFAARAGTHTARWWGEEIGDGHANCNGCGSEWDNKLLAPVDAFAPNGFGLVGMLGNAWEWTQDCWNANYAGAPSDGRAWEDHECSKRVLRGGSWGDNPWSVRLGFRGRNAAVYRSDTAGFRVVRGD